MKCLFLNIFDRDPGSPALGGVQRKAAGVGKAVQHSVTGSNAGHSPAVGGHRVDQGRHHAEHHGAQHAADGTLHRFVGTDDGGQLVLAAQHSGKEREGVAAKGDGQGQKHLQHPDGGHHPKPQQTGEHQGERQPGEDSAGDSGKGDALLLVIPVDSQGKDRKDEHRAQQGGEGQQQSYRFGN